MQVGLTGVGAHSSFIVFILFVLIISMMGLTAATASDVYTVANYPVEATARDAVAAKRQAISQGRRSAFRSLLKRIVPVTAYQSIKPLKQIDPRPLTKSVVVKSERSSATRYIATLDFAFSAPAVQAELKRAGISFVDTRAPTTIIVTLYNLLTSKVDNTTPTMSQAKADQLWRSVWSGLDLKNSITPLKLRSRTSKIKPAIIQSVAGGNFAALSTLAKHYGSARVVLAIAEPDLSFKRLNVIMVGQDASGRFSLKRQYRIDREDFAYTLEFAAVVSQGIIEGRWKATQAIPISAPIHPQSTQDIKIWVEFTNFAQWRGIQQAFKELQGVENFETDGLSTNGAHVKLRYRGDGKQLRDALALQGLSLQFYNNTWILR